MAKPNPEDMVHVIVHTKPNKVWVACDGVIHSARWRTNNDDGHGLLRHMVGNGGLLNAAMTAWDGPETFVLKFEELEKRSGGWGAWWPDTPVF